MEKCFWVLVALVRSEGEAHITSYNSSTTKGASIDIVSSEHVRRAVINRIGPGKHYHMLWVFISAEGEYNVEVEKHQRQI